LTTASGWGEINTNVLALLDFFADRLKVALRERGVRHDLIAAVFAVGGEDDLVRLLARVDALAAFLKTEDGANLLVAYQRAANIVRIEEKRDKRRYHGAELATDRLVEEAERLLGQRVISSEATAEKALMAEDFTAAMAALAALRMPVDDFFDRVTVNTENPELRVNRLRLLARIGATLNQVADFSKIEG
jgi:glycyl-tRNA synthetase beta chain